MRRAGMGLPRPSSRRRRIGRGVRPPVTAISTEDYPTPARRPPNSQLDSGRFAAAFGYRAIPWRPRVAETVQALLQPVETCV